MSAGLTLSSLPPQSAGRIRELALQCSDYLRPRPVADYWMATTLYPEYCLGMMAANRLVGIAIAFPHSTESGDRLYLQDIGVHPWFRRKGIAIRLLSGLSERAEQRQVCRLWLTSDAGNAAAHALWRKLGFRNVRGERRQNGCWVIDDMKGEGNHRAVFEASPGTVRAAAERCMGRQLGSERSGLAGLRLAS